MSLPMALGDELRVADVIRRQGAERGDVIAVRHGSRALTYGALDERSNRLAQALLAAGAGPGSRVAHLDRTGPEVIELLFAASKIGAVLVPLNWRLAVPELTRIVADAAAPLLIAGTAFADAASAIAGALPAPLRTVEVGPPTSGGSPPTIRSTPAIAVPRATRSCRCTRPAPLVSPRAS